ncbi:MAG: phosphatidate cytidylyltransferase [Clostridia bacterium]|nr:phosphatidate cytidylyltransferase [Clostridia bacterium]
MLVRTLSAFILLAAFIPCLIFSHLIPLLDIVLAVPCVIACLEILGCIKLKRVWLITVPTVIIAAGVPLCIRAIDTGIELSSLILLVFIIYMFLLLGVGVFSRGKYKIQDIALAFVMIFYIIFGFSSILSMRAMENGQYLYLLIFLSAWITDTGAYFTGVLFGKHKLIPDVSPKKTVEGAVGGLVFCVVSFIIFGFIMQTRYQLAPNYILLSVLALIMAVVSMCGDLVASLVKREYDLKDYSKLIPGHGGIMDRFDSIIATASVMSVILGIPYIANNIL